MGCSSSHIQSYNRPTEQINNISDSIKSANMWVASMKKTYSMHQYDAIIFKSCKYSDK